MFDPRKDGSSVRFVQRLERLLPGPERQEQRATLARLRRSLGRDFDDHPEALHDFEALASGLQIDACRWVYELVAGGFALLAKPGRRGANRHACSFATGLRQRVGQLDAKRPGNKKEARSSRLVKLSSFDRRVIALLDADRAGLMFRLPQLLQLWRGEDAPSILPFSWAQLIDDLQQWEHPDRWVQRRWARDYFTNPRVPTADQQITDTPDSDLQTTESETHDVD